MAVKSCTVCLASYCEAHLKPHLTMSGLRRHELMDPTENLEVRMCSKHDKQLELFCKTDQVSICLLCFVSDHKTHDIIPLKEAAGEKNGELEKADAEICEMIKERYAKIDEIRFAQNVSKNSENKEMAEGLNGWIKIWYFSLYFPPMLSPQNLITGDIHVTFSGLKTIFKFFKNAAKLFA
uniref:B box-type domain-containing protein n=1 Tax=Amphilophus citrinellus TaxID=61819 RepID=A0A3Q0SCF8_AMPCI